ncbi:MAG: NAD(P)/FAD-dependent oxidoreductase [Filomicrobium sp.]
MNNAIAIIGAGVAGLAAAECLRSKGVKVTIFEKSQGVGGRMATRRRDSLSFDHGAQYLTARTPSFIDEVRRWQEEGFADIWFDDKLVGVPGMTALAQDLARKSEVVFGQQISQLHHDETGWSLETEDDSDARYGKAKYGAVVLAIPAPQALALAKTAGIDLPELERPVYAPCLAMMLAFEQAVPSIPDRLLPDDPVIAWVGRNSSKPGRMTAPETFVVHATPEWSRRHLNHTREESGDLLLEAFYELTGERQKPTALMGHRWRYALVEEALGQSCVWRDDVRLGACGDWCLGPRVESAFESGVAMAEQIINAGKS